MTSTEIFIGDNLPIQLAVTNEPDDAVVSIAIVRGHTFTVASFTTSDGTLSKDGDTYTCELTKEQTSTLIPATYAVEAKVTSPSSGTTISPVGTIIVKRDKVHEI